MEGLHEEVMSPAVGQLINIGASRRVVGKTLVRFRDGADIWLVPEGNRCALLNDQGIGAEDQTPGHMKVHKANSGEVLPTVAFPPTEKVAGVVLEIGLATVRFPVADTLKPLLEIGLWSSRSEPDVRDAKPVLEIGDVICRGPVALIVTPLLPEIAPPITRLNKLLRSKLPVFVTAPKPVMLLLPVIFTLFPAKTVRNEPSAHRPLRPQ